MSENLVNVAGENIDPNAFFEVVRQAAGEKGIRTLSFKKDDFPTWGAYEGPKAPWVVNVFAPKGRSENIEWPSSGGESWGCQFSWAIGEGSDRSTGCSGKEGVSEMRATHFRGVITLETPTFGVLKRVVDHLVAGGFILPTKTAFDPRQCRFDEAIQQMVPVGPLPD